MELEDIRKKRGLNQEEVAATVGISRAAYTNIENGRRRPSPDVAMRIGKCLKFDWTKFFTDWKKFFDDNAQAKDEPA